MPLINPIFIKRLNKVVQAKQFGKRKLTKTVQKIVDGEIDDKPNPDKKSAWGYNGDSEYNTYAITLEDKPLIHLKKIAKKKPTVLILGPGTGKDLKYLKDDAKEIGISPEINVFGLTKITNHESAYSYINKDYSVGVPFEHLDPKIEKHRKIFEENLGKNDLIIALMSTSYHTKYLSFSMYQSAIFLSKGGKAYLEYSFSRISSVLEQLKTKFRKYENKTEEYILKDHFENRFHRFISHFNKTYKKEFKFKINWQPLNLYRFGYIEIERIN